MAKSSGKKELIYSVGGSPTGELATPINASGIVIWFINNLPAYRNGLTHFRRGLEVGMAHGYWLLGPFIKLGPFRNILGGEMSGLLSTITLVIIATMMLSLYVASEPPTPIKTITTPEIPDTFISDTGWSAYSTGFMVGGVGGAIFAYFLLMNLGLFRAVLNL